jgi:serine/threonine-protein kinase
MSAEERTRVMAPPEGVAVGTQLSGTYELDRRLASGGMGEVFRGHNIQTGDPVAIKIVLPEFASDAMILALFRKEASILNHLQHEAIVRYHVFAIDQAIGRPYLAMEFVDGASLVEMAASGPMPAAEARVLLARLVSGLSAAHEAGVVHRDLSPDNIILPGGNVARAKIIDFGIARSASVGGETLLGGTFAGKYNFVSPEQLGLFGGEITAQSDIYSLGLVIAAALRGRPLEMSGSQVEVIEKRRRVPDLSDIDEALRPVVEALLQPDPADRPRDMAEIAEWLRPPEHGRVGMTAATAATVAGATLLPAGSLPSQDIAMTRAQHTAPPVSESPFGPYTGPTSIGVASTSAAAPKLAEPRLAEPVAERPGPRRGGVAMWIALLLAGAGAAVAAAWFGGVLDPYLKPAPKVDARYLGWPDREPRPDGWASGPLPGKPSVPPEEVPSETAPPEAVPPEVARPEVVPPEVVPPEESGPEAVDDVAERVHWIRNFAGGPCFFAATSSASMQAVDVEGFGESVEPFRKLLAGFTEAFGTEPQITAGLIRHTQCPVTDFLDALDDRPSVAPGLSLERYELAKADPLAGEVRLLPSGQTYLLLVDHDGIVHNLETFLKRDGDRAAFRIPLGLATAGEDGAAGVPQVLVALGTTSTIETLRDASSRPAAEILPGILDELKRKGTTGAATAKFFRVRGQ